ncbi:hypothetical protein D3C72_2491970 [compost metagenome]
MQFFDRNVEVDAQAVKISGKRGFDPGDKVALGETAEAVGKRMHSEGHLFGLAGLGGFALAALLFGHGPGFVGLAG